ncbi:hypothetical protein [Vreelandella venusta]|uniref:hypothetical protein n=1 Tax=Vreelandella venusta TaxID=44935 RepID=UPI002285B80D|nr:hypothetical protein [Halomonas venusta]WAM50340.1 hypothetical protein L0521_09145 [Halomonas venusta]
MNYQPRNVEPFIRSPKACVSCQHYEHQGFDEDKHCPFQRSGLKEKPTRTPYGQCSRHGVQVFATQICNAHALDPHIECFDVVNRPEPRVAIQEGMEV